jgi:hypothetical protein
MKKELLRIIRDLPAKDRLEIIGELREVIDVISEEMTLPPPERIFQELRCDWN